jgi:hypothetical protein
MRVALRDRATKYGIAAAADAVEYLDAVTGTR